MTQKDIKDKYAIDEESKYETFYITGEDLEKAFIAGMQFQEKLAKKSKNE